VALLPALLFPLLAFTGSGLGCELLVNVDPMLVDGSPDDVVIPMTLDGYPCPICKDVSPTADLDGAEFFPEAEPEDAAPEASMHEGGHDAEAEVSTKDTGGSGTD